MIFVLFVGRKWMCDNCEWQSFADLFDKEILDNKKYEFAEDTLFGIFDWITDNKHITEKQKDAIKNIMSSVE